MYRGGVFVLLLAVSAVPAAADLSIFVASVGFDEEASLDNGVGAGVRWGKSSNIIGGETSLMIARPSRQLGAGVPEETTTAIFYEARLMFNIPLGLPVKPFLGVGLGAITVTSTDLPSGASEGLKAIAGIQTNRSLSYGIGARYPLNDKLSVRLDLRRYAVFSVTALIKDAATDAARDVARDALRDKLEEETGQEVPDAVLDAALAETLPMSAESKDRTVAHNEISIGINFRF